MATLNGKSKSTTVCNTYLVMDRHVRAIPGNLQAQHSTDCYIFSPVVGINESPEKGSSGTRIRHVHSIPGNSGRQQVRTVQCPETVTLPAFLLHTTFNSFLLCQRMWLHNICPAFVLQPRRE